MIPQDSSRLLRAALLANAAFSTLCGILLLAAATPLSPALGIPVLALRLTGAALLPFAFGLAHSARRPIVDPVEAWIAVVLDLSWVLGSAALVLGEFLPLTQAGVWAVLGVAEVVLAWAVLQAWGLRRNAQRIGPRARA